jgi:hypothetical protein
MAWMIAIYGFETEEEAEKARAECQIKYCKWAAKINEERRD